MSIKVHQLTKTYGSQKAVNEVSFEVATGQVLGFLGPNGAGKSTTMKMITCFLPPSSGTAEVAGYDILKAPMEVRRRIGYLPESNPLYYDMYVKEYLGFLAGVHQLGSKSKSRIAEMIELTGLQREQHKKIGQLSRGYKQRVGLAQALLHDPEVIILDEPTAGLDPNQLVEIRSLIKSLGRRKTVILSTHIMQEVQAMCDRVVIINRGNIVADDTAERLQQNLQQEAVWRVAFKETVDLKTIQRIAGVKQARQDKQAWILTAAKDADLSAAIFNFAKEQQLTLETLVKEQSSLEEIFQKLTN
ncbi:MAG: gliding motility-associated ABC transporter ATP-binding subunit GldA [Chitinophagales bacterium]|nr:gliding motility-associated ABC transporter ATP-binding subunit GldA [Chitinophagales bacterium]